MLTPPEFDAPGYLEAIQRCRELFASLRILSGAEIVRLVTDSDVFSVWAHIDYPVRAWPAYAGRFDPSAFEGEFRHALRATAESGRAPEIDTIVPLHSTVVRWWRQEGGEVITFGSDAHEPAAVARFRDAEGMAQAHGFRPGLDPHDFWTRAHWITAASVDPQGRTLQRHG